MCALLLVCLLVRGRVLALVRSARVVLHCDGHTSCGDLVWPLYPPTY